MASSILARRSSLLPSVREELFQLGDRRSGDSGQYAGEVALRVESVTFCGCDEAVKCCDSFGCNVVSGEEPVLAADADSTQRSFGGVIVDVQESPRSIDVESVPLVEHVGDRLCHRASRQDQLLLGLEPRLDRCEYGRAVLLTQGQTDRVSFDGCAVLGRGDLRLRLVLHGVEFPHHREHLGAAA